MGIFDIFKSSGIHAGVDRFRSHPDATIYTIAEATKCPIPEIRVYNK